MVKTDYFTLLIIFSILTIVIRVLILCAKKKLVSAQNRDKLSRDTSMENTRGNYYNTP